MVPVLMVPRYLTDASLNTPRLVCYAVHDEPIVLSHSFSRLSSSFPAHERARASSHPVPLASQQQPTSFPAPHFPNILPNITLYFSAPHSPNIAPASHSTSQHHIPPTLHPHHTLLLSTTFPQHCTRITLYFSARRFSRIAPASHLTFQHDVSPALHPHHT
jgi:hypothetical protein